MFVNKTSKGNNVLETFIAGLKGQDRGRSQQEDGEEAEHAESDSGHAVMGSLRDQPFKQSSYLLHRISNI
jgi:hypothetical protein